MSLQSSTRHEAVGPAFSPESMNRIRVQAKEAVRRIAAAVRPGMNEQQACEDAMAILKAMGIERVWHPVIVRFGAGTLTTFRERSDPARVLGSQDIYYVDIGPVWDGHEGDAGDTFVTGDDPEMHACAEAARSIWEDVSRHWREERIDGESLYRFAAERAHAAGWRLNLDIKGHRLSDYPHAVYAAGPLGNFAQRPATGLWVLEIQIAHPTRPFGAFYEDLLLAEPALA